MDLPTFVGYVQQNSIDWDRMQLLDIVGIVQMVMDMLLGRIMVRDYHILDRMVVDQMVCIEVVVVEMDSETIIRKCNIGCIKLSDQRVVFILKTYLSLNVDEETSPQTQEYSY